MDGDKPAGIAFNPISNKVYVSNIGSETVSVLDVSDINNFRILKNITVNPMGPHPYTMKRILSWKSLQFRLSVINRPCFDLTDNSAHLEKISSSNTISVIDGETDSVAVRITFECAPLQKQEI